jgi:hypothetical protein
LSGDIIKVNKAQKKIARNILHKAIRKGKIIRPDKCAWCDKICKPEGHHLDYYIPFDVIFLCHKCHKLEHKRLRKLNRRKRKK